MKNRNKNPFLSIGSAKIERSAFDLSYDVKTTIDPGYIYPILIQELVPGDIVQVSNSAFLRMNPSLAPIMDTMDMVVSYFECPYRILDDNFIEFITRGEDGQSSLTPPLWDPTNGGVDPLSNQVGKIWDYMGFPVEAAVTLTGNSYPVDWLRRGYNRVWNEYFRDEQLQAEVAETNENILPKAYDKGYFESALPWAQRGIVPVMPVTGSVDFNFPAEAAVSQGADAVTFGFRAGSTQDFVSIRQADGTSSLLDTESTATSTTDLAHLSDIFSSSNTIDASSVNINDLRLSFQLQVWMERNARGGVRYPEFLLSHHNVTIPDETVQRPVFRGYTRNPVTFSEVIQTSSTASEPTPQGYLTGKGVSLQHANVTKFRVKEYGFLLGVIYVYPKASYYQGINRCWTRYTAYDYFFPEFVGLGEQEIYGREVCVSNSATYNADIWGYTGRYNEMRYNPNKVTGLMREDFDYWHFARKFDVTAPPTLDSTFIEVDQDKRFLAVPSEPAFMLHFGNHLNMIRPLPFVAEPFGLG